MASKKYAYDVFISYRRVSPDQEWVREKLYPALVAAGLRVCLDVEDFLPGRDLILEMERAGRESRHAICVLSPDYFHGNRMVGFESLMLRRFDPSGKESRLIPLILRPVKSPQRISGLVAIDWIDPSHHVREWRKLLRVIKAKDMTAPAPGSLPREMVTVSIRSPAIDVTAPTSFTDLLSACKKQIDGEIGAVVGDKYIPSLYIDRAAHSTLMNFVSKRPLLGEQFMLSALAAADAIKADIHLHETRIKNSVIEGAMREGIAIRARKEKLTKGDIEKLKNLAKQSDSINAIIPLIEHVRNLLRASDPSLLDIRPYLEQLELHPGCTGDIRTHLDGLIHSLRNGLLIKDVAGRGKTNLVCALAQELGQWQPTILIAAGALRLDDKFSLERYIQASLGYSSHTPVHDFMQRILSLADAQNHEILIIIDAINENPDTHLLKIAIQSFLSQHKDHNLKCVVTCRDIYWDGFLHTEGDFWKQYLYDEITLGDFTYEEFSRAVPLYFERFKIKANLSPNAVKKLRHPLLLRFFCEAHRDPHKLVDLGHIKDIRLKPLFDIYWQKKLSTLREKLKHRDSAVLEEFLLGLARKMRFNRDRNLSLEDITRMTNIQDFETPDSVYTRVLDESIILEQIPEESSIRRMPRVTFVYDEFMEYVMARDLIGHTMNTQNTLKLRRRFGRILRSANRFNSIYGVVAYLLLMMEEQLHFDGWQQVFMRGDKWYLPLCKSLSRILPYNLSDNAIAIAGKLAQANDQEVTREMAQLAKEISKVRPDKVVPLLRTLINTTLQDVRLLARDSLVSLASDGNQQAISLLIDCLGHIDSRVRATAVYALAELAHLEANHVNEAARDRTSFVREAAMFAITSLNDSDAQLCDEALKNGLLDNRSEVRAMAARVLGQIGRVDFQQNLKNAESSERDPSVRKTMKDSLVALQRKENWGVT